MTGSENLKYLLKQLTWEEAGGNGLPVLTPDPGHCHQGHQQCGITHSYLQHSLAPVKTTLTASWLAAAADCGASVAGRYHAHPTAQIEGGNSTQQWSAADIRHGERLSDIRTRMMHFNAVSRFRRFVFPSSSMDREDGGSILPRNVCNH